MKLIKDIKIKDLIKYESDNNVNILNSLGMLELDVIVDLIMLGNNCDESEAIDILSMALDNNDLEGIVKELVKELVGEDNVNNEETVDVNEYKSFKDILMSFYNELQAVDEKLTFTEFMNFDLEIMYTYAKGISDRYLFNENKELRSQYTNVAMFMSALAGKLDKCPQIEKDDMNNENGLSEEVKDWVKNCKGRR